MASIGYVLQLVTDYAHLMQLDGCLRGAASFAGALVFRRHWRVRVLVCSPLSPTPVTLSVLTKLYRHETVEHCSQQERCWCPRTELSLCRCRLRQARVVASAALYLSCTLNKNLNTRMVPVKRPLFLCLACAGAATYLCAHTLLSLIHI